MSTLIHADIFFFISSIGFILMWILLAILIFYLIRATRIFSEILSKIEKDIDQIGDTTKEMIEEMHDSTIFRLLFGKKKTRHKHIK